LDPDKIYKKPKNQYKDERKEEKGLIDMGG